MRGRLYQGVIAVAMGIFIAGGVVSAQAPAGTGSQPAAEPAPAEPSDEQPAEPREQAAPEQPQEGARPEQDGQQTAPPEPFPPADLATPKPAGVGSAPAAPAADPMTDGEDPSLAESAVAPGMAPVPTSRPFQGVFGGAAPVRREGQTLNFTASGFGIQTTGDSLDRSRPGALANDTFRYGGAGASLDYSRNWRHANVGATGDASLAYIPELDDGSSDPWIDRWSAGADAGFNTDLSRKTQISGGASVDYSPYYQQNLLTQAGVPTISTTRVGTPGLDFTLGRHPSINSRAAGTLSYAVSRRGSLEALYALTRRDFTEDESVSYHDQLVGGRYVYRVSRWLGLRAGYAYRTVNFGAADTPPIHSHDIDVGADGGYGRSFSLSRRTTFSFNTGSSLVAQQRTAFVDRADAGDTRLRFVLTGSTDLLHAWGRTWSANVGASRSVGYQAGFGQTFLTNQAYGGIGGLLAPRVDVQVTGAYTAGEVGFGGADNGFDTASLVGSIRWAFARNLAAYAQYFYYRYSFDSAVVLPVFLQRGLDRRGVSIGLTAWLPIIGSRGRP